MNAIRSTTASTTNVICSASSTGDMAAENAAPIINDSSVPRTSILVRAVHDHAIALDLDHAHLLPGIDVLAARHHVHAPVAEVGDACGPERGLGDAHQPGELAEAAFRGPRLVLVEGRPAQRELAAERRPGEELEGEAEHHRNQQER